MTRGSDAMVGQVMACQAVKETRLQIVCAKAQKLADFGGQVTRRLVVRVNDTVGLEPVRGAEGEAIAAPVIELTGRLESALRVIREQFEEIDRQAARI